MELSEVKQNLNRMVLYRSDVGETPYRFTGCILRRGKNNQLFYQAELEDVRNNHSLLICRLEDVKFQKEIADLVQP